MPTSLLVDQRKILFFRKKTVFSCKTVLVAMSKLHYNDFQKLASTYSISCLDASNTDIQMAIWCHFSSSFTQYFLFFLFSPVFLLFIYASYYTG